MRSDSFAKHRRKKHNNKERTDLGYGRVISSWRSDNRRLEKRDNPHHQIHVLLLIYILLAWACV
jgi:hypothetical protein